MKPSIRNGIILICIFCGVASILSYYAANLLSIESLFWRVILWIIVLNFELIGWFLGLYFWEVWQDWRRSDEEADRMLHNAE